MKPDKKAPAPAKPKQQEKKPVTKKK